MAVYNEGLSGGKMIAVLLAVLILLVGAFFGVKAYNASQEESAAGDLMLSYKIDDLDEVSYTLDGTLVELYRNDDGNWEYAQDVAQELDQDAVETMLESSSKIYAETMVAEDLSDKNDYGLDSPSFVLTLQLKDGTSKTLYVGDQNDMSGKYYAYIKDDDRIFAMSDDISSSFSDISSLMVEEEEELSE